ncbi:MAG: hypothetical protein Q9203_001370 [Teloschistes exilis]
MEELEEEEEEEEKEQHRAPGNGLLSDRFASLRTHKCDKKNPHAPFITSKGML